MGYSSSFGDCGAHVLLMLRDDAELHIMDCMKKAFYMKAKSDREYALSLSAITQQGSKIDRSDMENGGCLATAWRGFIEQTDHLAKQLKINADKIETLCQKFSQLMQDKRKAHKIYCEEHDSIVDRLNHLTVECARKKSEYEKNLDAYKVQRTRFEEHYVKSGRSGRKLEDVREKYQKACRKLHVAHNEYVLLLFEAKEVEKDFRSTLLPMLLDYQQNLQKNFILLLKNIMQEMIGCCDLTSEKFKEIQEKTLRVIDCMDPVEEYRLFRDKTITVSPSATFEFDCELLDDIPTKLRSNSLIVDNLTIDWLRSKLSDLEFSTKECQQRKRNNYQNSDKSDFIGTSKESDDNKCEQSTGMSLQRCLQKQKLKLIDLIKTALNQEGSAEHLPECENLSIEVKFTVNDRAKICSTKRSLHEEEWFHGVLPREEVVRLLKNEGDFLVRQTLRNDESQIVLSVCWNGHKHFIVQKTPEGLYRFEGPSFCSIQELINHQLQSELPVTVKSGTVLKKPIVKEVWELSNDDVVLLEKIGKGNFGDVYKAHLIPSKLEVAVKTCKVTLPDEQKRKFLSEGRILKQYNHPNIVKLIGICVQKQPIMIVMELVPGGSLLSYLRHNSDRLTTKQMIVMSKDAAAGMQYLESKNCIHRDLAARNCLIDHQNTVKISDFGMSREEAEYIVSDGMKQIPVKWTAPEALHFGKYTILCDVWSYGVLLWEIFSKGDTPYSGMNNSKARELIDSGYRMPAPENTPAEVYRLMLKCWSIHPEVRPHFDEIYATLDFLFSHEDVK